MDSWVSSAFTVSCSYVMPGSPRKRARREAAGLPPVGGGEGVWSSMKPAGDPESDAARAKSIAVKREKREIARLAKFEREEAFQAELLPLVPVAAEQAKQMMTALSALTERLAAGEKLDRDELALFRALVKERKETVVDRYYGSVTQRSKHESSHTSLSADVGDLLRLGVERAEGLALRSGGEIVDVEGEEVTDGD